MSHNQQIDRALHNALACRKNRKRAEEALTALRRKEEDAIEHLKEVVRDCETRTVSGR